VLRVPRTQDDVGHPGIGPLQLLAVVCEQQDVGVGTGVRVDLTSAQQFQQLLALVGTQLYGVFCRCMLLA